MSQRMDSRDCTTASRDSDSCAAASRRRDDIPLLANNFLKRYAPAAGKSINQISKSVLADLSSYDWPGNVRQLENAMSGRLPELTEELHVELPLERQKSQGSCCLRGRIC